MFKRRIAVEIQELAKGYPVLTIIGPRQSGKTTIAKEVFSKKAYVSLEDPDVRRLALEDPRGFLSQYSEGAILDEIQRAPHLLSYIQGIVDQKQLKGMFILTGSHQLELQHAVSQSLAGRTALVTLLPMSLDELSSAGIDLTLDDYMIKGGYPRIYKDTLDPTKAYRNYFQTYVERDLKQLIQVKDLSQFEKFVRICAGRIGQVVNLEEIGGEVGLSSHTVKEWISILEASFIVFKLQPYFENFGKRIIKSPKLFFTDVGLAAYLLGIETTLQLARDPLRGHLVENLVLLELVKWRFNHGLDPNLYYYRDVQKNEVDILFKEGALLTPIEVKSSQTYNSSFLKNIHFFQKMAKDRFSKGYIVYAGDIEQSIGEVTLVNYKKVVSCISPKDRPFTVF